MNSSRKNSKLQLYPSLKYHVKCSNLMSDNINYILERNNLKDDQKNSCKTIHEFYKNKSKKKISNINEKNILLSDNESIEWEINKTAIKMFIKVNNRIAGQLHAYIVENPLALDYDIEDESKYLYILNFESFKNLEERNCAINL